jgi:hypothetical protein
MEGGLLGGLRVASSKRQITSSKFQASNFKLQVPGSAREFGLGFGI